MNAHAHTYRTTKEDIVALRYLKNPKRAAYELGITAEEVKKVWAEIPETRLKSHKSHGTDTSGLNALNEAMEDARLGSLQLKNALNKFFAKWERENRFRPGAGKLLVPAGWRE